jgi:hypothetical protein
MTKATNTDSHYQEQKKKKKHIISGCLSFHFICNQKKKKKKQNIPSNQQNFTAKFSTQKISNDQSNQHRQPLSRTKKKKKKKKHIKKTLSN